MARGKTTEDSSILQMALIGYQMEKDKIDAKIKEIEAQLKGTKVSGAGGGESSDREAGT